MFQHPQNHTKIVRQNWRRDEQNRLLSDESISCSQAMCLRTSTFVVKPMLLISTHWLLWRCDPLDLCSDRPSETQKATFLRAGASSFPLILMFMSTGQKLGFSLLRSAAGKFEFLPCTRVPAIEPRPGCVGSIAMATESGGDLDSAGVPSEQAPALLSVSASAARWR